MSVFLPFVIVLVNVLLVTAKLQIPPTQVVMDANWKWEASTAPRWTSAFLGTNDIFGKEIDDIVKRLKTFDTEELELVGVVGGLKYLQILGRMNFSRVTFYDSNINELSKLRLVHKRIVSLSYDEWTVSGGLLAVNTYVVRNHDKFYLPNDLYKYGVKMVASPDFRWPQSTRHLYQDPKGPDARSSPMWTLNNPILFPEYTWNPSREEYNNVRFQLTQPGVVNDRFYLKLPVGIASPHRLAVVWCDGVQFPWGRVRLVSPVAMAIGFYANFSSQPIWLEDEGKKLNDAWNDAHFWWETRVRLHLRGEFDRYLHLWPPEHKSFQVTAYDYPFRKAVLLADSIVRQRSSMEALEEIKLEEAETVLFHIYMGTYAGEVDDDGRMRTNCSKRLSYFQRYLRVASNKINSQKIKRIIITEYNKESKEFHGTAKEPPCALTRVELLAIVSETFAGSEYYMHDRTYYMPGETTYDKNMMIILDNKLFDRDVLRKNNDVSGGDSVCISRGTAKGQCKGANIGPGYAYRNYLQSKATWIENAMTVNLNNNDKRLAFFFPKGAAEEIVQLFAGQFCQQHLILDVGAYRRLSEAAMDERNMLKVNAGLYPVS